MDKNTNNVNCETFEVEDGNVEYVHPFQLKFNEI